jgi:hypothetical protein
MESYMFVNTSYVLRDHVDAGELIQGSFKKEPARTAKNVQIYLK